MPSNDPYAAKVQPLRAEAIAGYLEAYRAAMGQTAATSSSAQPATADDHLIQITSTVHVTPTDVPAGACRKCGVPFSHHGCHEDGPYCEYCVTQCRQRQSALHLCEICR